MVGVFQRVTTFVLAIVAVRIAEYDAVHPYSAARRVWYGVRQKLIGPAQRCDFQCIYLDDGMGVTVLAEGEPLRGVSGRESRQKLICESHAKHLWKPDGASQRKKCS